MNLYLPRDCEFLTVEFACPGGGTYKQRVATWALKGERAIAKVIAAAVKSCKRKGIAVATCLSITHKKAVLFAYQADTGARFGR